MVTLKDIAQSVGISITAVSRIINDPTFGSDETRKKVFSAIENMGYVRNNLARNMKLGTTHQIALIINDITNPFFSQIARGVEDICSLNGYSLFLCNSDDDIYRESFYLDQIRGKTVDGFIISVASEYDSKLSSIDYSTCPYVMISRKHQDVSADYVGFADYDGAYSAVSYLIKNGHRRIATITGIIDTIPGKDRLKGYMDALRDNDIPIRNEYVGLCNFRSDSAYMATGRFLDLEKWPTAIFVANNVMTRGCIQMFKEKNIKVPGDISLITFYEPSWAQIHSPALTCVTANAYYIGTNAAKMLIKRIEGDTSPFQSIVLPTTLIERESCRNIVY